MKAMQQTGWIYRYIFELGAPTMVLDAQTMKVMAANPQLEDLTGRPLIELVGNPPEFLSREDGEEEQDMRRLQTAQVHRHDGTTIDVEVTLVAMEQVPNPAYIIKIDSAEKSRDEHGPATLRTKHEALQRTHRELQTVYNKNELLIDELYHRNQELQKVYRRLSYASKMATIGELAAGTTHGINNPLAAAVSANRELAKKLDQLQDQDLERLLRPLCSRTDRALIRIEGIVEDLRRLAQAGSRREEVKRVVLDQEIQLAIDLLRHRFKNIQLEIDLPKNVGIRVAPDEFGQVIMNLIDNAIHAMDGQGHLHILGQVNGNEVLIQFIDDGSGIEADIIDKIFDPFFSTKSPGHGSGIGLSVVRGIIEGYAGSITVTSQAGGPTRFKIRLPIEEIHENQT